MHVIPHLRRALTLAALLPAAAAAQQTTSQFANSWFWGLGGGQASLPSYFHRVDAPLANADWLITREHVALRVYASQAFFTDSSTISDPNPSGLRKVNVTDLRRVGFEGIFFLPHTAWFRPYAGLGFAFNDIRKATLIGSQFVSAAARDSALTRVNDARATTAATLSGGFMFTWRRLAPYAQYTFMPAKGDGGWLLNGNGSTAFLEAGLRYNFGSAIENLR